MNKKLEYFGDKKKTELSEFDKLIIDNYKERFSKWHSRQLDYLTFSINLFLLPTISQMA